MSCRRYISKRADYKQNFSEDYQDINEVDWKSIKNASAKLAKKVTAAYKAFKSTKDTDGMIDWSSDGSLGPGFSVEKTNNGRVAVYTIDVAYENLKIPKNITIYSEDGFVFFNVFDKKLKMYIQIVIIVKDIYYDSQSGKFVFNYELTQVLYSKNTKVSDMFPEGNFNVSADKFFDLLNKIIGKEIF